MDVIHERCVGIDISKTDVKVCIRVSGGGRVGCNFSVTAVTRRDADPAG